MAHLALVMTACFCNSSINSFSGLDMAFVAEDWISDFRLASQHCSRYPDSLPVSTLDDVFQFSHSCRNSSNTS